jgi:hypothetical protein
VGQNQRPKVHRGRSRIRPRLAGCTSGPNRPATPGWRPTRSVLWRGGAELVKHLETRFIALPAWRENDMAQKVTHRMANGVKRASSCFNPAIWPPAWLASPPAEPTPPTPPVKATVSASSLTPLAEPVPLPSGPVCRRHPLAGVVDVLIHGGRSARRDCARCGRFVAFTTWYGHPSLN